MKQLRVISSLIIIVAMLMVAVPAQAAPPDAFVVTFGSCSYNKYEDAKTGWDQFKVYVYPDTWANGSGVAFEFQNAVGKQSSITDVFFDDGTLFALANIEESAGVAFSQNASPPNLPGGENCIPDFVTNEGFSADSDPPKNMENGVNATNEYVIINFTLQGSKTVADVITALGDGSLRIGIHAQGFYGGGSEAFVNRGATAIKLASFGARSNKGSTTLAWTTGTEIDNAGFNIYRSNSADGARTRLNSKLLAARGDAVSGGSYTFSDSSGYGTFYYWLEDVSNMGTATLHGPVLAVVTSPFRSPLYRPALPSR